jgi:hypothetical protein
LGGDIFLLLYTIFDQNISYGTAPNGFSIVFQDTECL